MPRVWRNAIFTALLAQLQTVQMPASPGNVVLWSQRFVPWETCDAQPAVMLLEGPQTTMQKTWGQPQWRFKALVLVYFQTDPSLDGTIPAQQVNDVVDAFEAALAPPVQGAHQNLGGTCVHAFVEGDVVFEDGSTDRTNQALISIPITIVA
ncbi:MAG: hypothetical protein ACRD2H_11460 [Terriglobales bacterium]